MCFRVESMCLSFLTTTLPVGWVSCSLYSLSASPYPGAMVNKFLGLFCFVFPHLQLELKLALLSVHITPLRTPRWLVRGSPASLKHPMSLCISLKVMRCWVFQEHWHLFLFICFFVCFSQRNELGLLYLVMFLFQKWFCYFRILEGEVGSLLNSVLHNCSKMFRSLGWQALCLKMKKYI